MGPLSDTDILKKMFAFFY